MKKSAFTLIELLVVIAIIAILAAILFPVFAQAKLAAKAAVSLSNTKQQSLAAIMYAADYDDYLPLGTAWHTGKDQLCYAAPVGCFATWAWSVQPYMKSSGLFADPTTAPNIRRASGQDNFDTFYVQYGYNYTFLSPFFPANDAGNSNQAVSSMSQTQATAPANTVMMASKWTAADNLTPYNWGTGFPGGMLFDAGVEVPDCATIPMYCATNWGKGGFFDQTNPNNGILLPLTEGRYTGGNAYRAAAQVVVGWLDGHSKKMTPQALAVGTNWTAALSQASLVVTAKANYLWTVDKS